MGTTHSRQTMLDELRQRRLWYHDIHLPGGLRTRFDGDYAVNDVLRRVDQSCERIIDRLRTDLPASLAGLSVLDLGCADGRFSFWAADQGAARVVGVERNRYNHAHAEFIRDSFGYEQVEFIWGSLEQHCPEETFDIVLCLGLLYHVRDPLGTLHALRSRCGKLMIATTALDLPDGDQPLCRLDRYATGAHGMWSFNAAMVRQMVSTAGFTIREDLAEPNPAGGSHFTIVAESGDWARHHIFSDRIDQEFPINVDGRRQRVRRIWASLPTDRPVAIFGAGMHTPWLMSQVEDLPGPEVTCVLDDRLPPTGQVAGMQVCRPTEVDPSVLGGVLLSSWHQTGALQQRAEEVFRARVPIIRLDQD